MSEKVGAVMVVGAGIAGIQASLDLAESGYFVYLVEKSPAIGGTMPMLDKTFPTNDCSMCILSPKLVECGRHLNIKILACSELIGLEGEPGKFKATIKKNPRYVDVDKCKSCGDCAEACPQEVDDEFNQKLGPRKAIYKPYAQAFPNAFVIDKENCLDCGSCEEACQANAIDYSMEEETLEIEIGAVIFCPGFEKFEASSLDYYGYGRLPNVVTSLEFERILSASGPFQGHMVRPSDHKEPKKIAWIQCVGSRNVRNLHGYCSAVCCMYAVKEAIIAKEHSAEPLDTAIFFMDMRTYGKGFEKYYERAKGLGVRFIRTRAYGIEEVQDDSGNLQIRYFTEDGKTITEQFDLVVLSVGLEPSEEVVEVAKNLGLELNTYSFSEPEPFSGVGSSRQGVFVAGAFSGPKDIPETVMQASAAAGESARILSEARGTMVAEKIFPSERDVSGEEPRIGVFVCHCGINIGSVVNVPAVVESARKLPKVVFADEYLYVCSQDSQATMRQIIEENNINRVVVASCSPRTHKPLFQETMREAGLNRHLFEMANIRDQCSWVHMNEPEKATEKAIDLVKMVVAKAALLEPTPQISVGVTKSALVVGGGVAGMTAALSLAELGFDVNLTEKAEKLGGNALRIKEGLKGEDVQTFLADLIDKVKSNPRINIYTGSDISDVSGYIGNFITTLSSGQKIEHGITVIATGAEEYKPKEYLYGETPQVMTQLELGEAIAAGDPRVLNAKNVVLIQCVGSRDEERMYCSRVCCGKAVKLALKLKEINPKVNVYVLYRDVRTYGFLEDNYRLARNKGVIFVRYIPEDKPVVELTDKGLKITVNDMILGARIVIPADLIGLAAAIVPPEGNKRLSQLFKIPLNEDGFFLEAHMKLRPVDFASEGIFMAGTAHGPKSLEENIAQAKAAAGRAATILSKDILESRGVVAKVSADKCQACLTCVRLCPYNAPRIKDNVAEIEAVVCQGCGTCAGECPNKAIQLQGYKDHMLIAMSEGLFAEVS